MATVTRDELYGLVWARPMTSLAKEFGISDVALHKTCRKHDIPTPPQGYWAKKQFGKPVTVTPLPVGHPGLIVIHERAGRHDSPAVAEVLGRVHDALQFSALENTHAPSDAIVVASLAKLAKEKPGKDGLVRVEGDDLVSIAVRPESVERAKFLLASLVEMAGMVGIRVVPGPGGARWAAEGEKVSFSLRELADRVEHEPTAQELHAVAKWEAERQANFKRTGYLRDWGRPFIPRWEERYQGRLSFVLEEVRDRTRHEYGGPTLRNKFADTKVRDVAKAIPRVVAAIATAAVTKRENAVADVERAAVREEAERRRRELERLAAIERKRGEGLVELLELHARKSELASLIAGLDDATAGGEAQPRVVRLRLWLEARREELAVVTAPGALEAWLAKSGLFGEDEG